MSRRLLFIKQDHVSPTGPVGEAFSDLGYDITDLLVVPEDRFLEPGVTASFPDPTDFDVVVPMGAPWSVYDQATIGSWVGDEITFLRKAHEQQVPVFGICFGGQALAAALGGEVVRAEAPEIGWRTIQTDRPSLVEPGPWFQWHSDRWLLPEGTAALARTDLAEQAFVSGTSMGLQFHPELTPGMLDAWLRNGGEGHAEALGIDVELLVAETRVHADDAAARARELVRRFVAQVARPNSADGW